MSTFEELTKEYKDLEWLNKTTETQKAAIDDLKQAIVDSKSDLENSITDIIKEMSKYLEFSNLFPNDRIKFASKETAHIFSGSLENPKNHYYPVWQVSLSKEQGFVVCTYENVQFGNPETVSFMYDTDEQTVKISENVINSAIDFLERKDELMGKLHSVVEEKIRYQKDTKEQLCEVQREEIFSLKKTMRSINQEKYRDYDEFEETSEEDEYEQ